MTLKIWITLTALVACLTIAVSGQEKRPSKPVSSKRSAKAPKPLTVSCSICGQKAIYLPKPIYPAHFNASGNVSVKVLIDEKGNVISTEVLSGHPLLRASSVKAATQAKFTPTRIGGKSVRIYTTIVYRFTKSM